MQLFLALCIIFLLKLEALKKVHLINLLKSEISYEVGIDYQTSLMNRHIDAQMQKQEISSCCVGSVLLLQHKAVYTLGTATQSDSGPFTTILQDGSKLEYQTYKSDRAGQATFHGPGQIVMYPILDLNYFGQDINTYLRSLEQTVIDTCTALGIQGAGRVNKLTGVWINDSVKIAAIGIKLRRWVTMHGLSVNVNPDLRYFSNIIPCGISEEGKCVGSLSQYRGDLSIDIVSDLLLSSFADIFQISFDPIHEGEVTALNYLEHLSLRTN